MFALKLPQYCLSHGLMNVVIERGTNGPKNNHNYVYSMYVYVICGPKHLVRQDT